MSIEFHARLSWAWLVVLAMQATWVVAAEQPPAINEPGVGTATAFKPRFASYLSASRGRDSYDLSRDAAMAAEWSDLQWQLQDLVNRKQTLEVLAGLGIEQRSDGSVELDVKKFPQVVSLHERLVPFDQPHRHTTYFPLLRERGFQEGDLEKLQTYVRSHRLQRLTHEAVRHEVESFASFVRSRTAQQVSLAHVNAHRYRLRRLADDAQRQWAEGLLGVLGSQPQRILVSLMEELIVAKVIAPDQDVEGALAKGLAAMRSPEFERRLRSAGTESNQ